MSKSPMPLSMVNLIPTRHKSSGKHSVLAMKEANLYIIRVNVRVFRFGCNLTEQFLFLWDPPIIWAKEPDLTVNGCGANYTRKPELALSRLRN